MIRSNDQPPAHVHVVGDGHESLFRLNCPKGPPEHYENYAFSRSVMKKVQRWLAEGEPIVPGMGEDPWADVMSLCWPTPALRSA
jgi:Domain of unknown function (DUF4160)